MTTKEPRVTNGLIAIAQQDGAWIYILPDEISSIEYIPVVEVAEQLIAKLIMVGFLICYEDINMSKRPDWEAIESAYRAGVMTIREITFQYATTNHAISKRAKKEGWERDLKAKVKAIAENLVAKREVATLVASEMILFISAI